VLDAIRNSAKGELKASGTGQGGIWHLALAGMLQDAGIAPDQVQWVPSQGAAPGLQDLVAGGVQMVTCSTPEAKSLIDAGKVRSLAVMSDAPAALYPNVPTLKAATGSDWKLGAWRGIAAPKGIPPEARDKLVAAVRKIAAAKEYTEFMSSRGFGVIYQGPDDFAKFMAKADADLGATMKAVGIAK
jgi:tripartite-type tricarboxylate transporter receptor subunit TctC